MKEAKPILIIRYPMEALVGVRNCIDQVVAKLNDYHVLFIIDKSETALRFEGLYPKDFDKVEFEKVVKYVRKQMQENHDGSAEDR